MISFYLFVIIIVLQFETQEIDSYVDTTILNINVGTN